MVSTVLAQRSLVLNRAWSAITTTTVRHALGLLSKGAARAIRTDSYELHTFESWLEIGVSPDEPCVRTVSLRIKIPEVIVLVRYGGMPRCTVAFSRRTLFQRDESTCQYCGARPGSSELSIDHVFPRSRGGASSWENCVLACARCNRKKGDRLPDEVGLHLLRPPCEPRWSPVLDATNGHLRQSWRPFVSKSHWELDVAE